MGGAKKISTKNIKYNYLRPKILAVFKKSNIFKETSFNVSKTPQ